MAIIIKTTKPSVLLADIKEQIDQKKIETWLVDRDGDFTHDADQWRYRAWLRPFVEENRLVMGILCRTDKNISVSEYAVFHGRFVEMILTHFDEMCTEVTATSLPTKYDRISNL